MAGRGAKIVVAMLGTALFIRVSFFALDRWRQSRPDDPVTARDRPEACHAHLVAKDAGALTLLAADAEARKRWISTKLGPEELALVDVVDRAKPMIACSGTAPTGVAIAVTLPAQAFAAYAKGVPHNRSSMLGRHVYETSKGLRFARFDDVVVFAETATALTTFGPYLGFAARTPPSHALELHVNQRLLSTWKGLVAPPAASLEARVNAVVQAHMDEIEDVQGTLDLVDGQVVLRTRLRLKGEARSYLDALPVVAPDLVRRASSAVAEVSIAGPAIQPVSEALVSALLGVLADIDGAATDVKTIRQGLGSVGLTSTKGDEQVFRLAIVDEPGVRSALKTLRGRLGGVQDSRIGDVDVTSVPAGKTVYRWAIVDGTFWLALGPAGTSHFEALLAARKDKVHEVRVELRPVVEGAGLRGYFRDADLELAVGYANATLELSAVGKPATFDLIKAISP